MYNHQLDAFIRVAELGSFGKAAESLYLSVPSVIQQINLLESRCGFKLFERSNRGVKLTPAGESFYEDARTIIRLSSDALSRGRTIADASEHVVRIGTALLYQCHAISQIWPSLCMLAPDMKMEIVPVPVASRSDSIAALGTHYDILEGVLPDSAWAGHCDFEELGRLPLCCAVPSSHRCYGCEKLSLSDLDGETLVTVVPGASKAHDALRADLLALCPHIAFIDSSYYGMDTFMLCEVNNYILISHATFADIHPNLHLIPLEPTYTVPYGLRYSKTPSKATQRFLTLLRQTPSIRIPGIP